MQQETAQILALRVLGWLAAQDELFMAFLGASGCDVAQLRAAAQEPGVLCAVLDFVMGRDDWVLECAAALSERPEQLALARAVLGGGDQYHWT